LFGRIDVGDSIDADRTAARLAAAYRTRAGSDARDARPVRDREADRKTDDRANCKTDHSTDGKADGQTDREADGHADAEADRNAGSRLSAEVGRYVHVPIHAVDDRKRDVLGRADRRALGAVQL
jgi:hypothetical protein